MKKSPILFLAITAGLSSLSMYYNPSTDLLDDHDYEQARIDASHGPALSAPLDGSPYWESYNQWLCFPAQSIDMSCLEADYGEIRKVPALHVTESSHYFEFTLDPEPAPDCGKIIGRWKALLEDEGAFCVYAARLQDLDVSAYDTDARDGSVWIINELKTPKGYWHFEADENWLNPDSPDDDAPPENDSGLSD